MNLLTKNTFTRERCTNDSQTHTSTKYEMCASKSPPTENDVHEKEDEEKKNPVTDYHQSLHSKLFSFEYKGRIESKRKRERNA